MKNYLWLLMIGVLLGFAGCKRKSNDEDPLTSQLNMMTKSWKVTSARVGTLDQSTEYASFILTLSGTDSNNVSFTTSGAAATIKTPWPKSGTMKLNTTSTFTRSDNISGNYTVSTTQLTMDFTYPDTQVGYDARTEGLIGDWKFIFQPN